MFTCLKYEKIFLFTVYRRIFSNEIRVIHEFYGKPTTKGDFQQKYAFTICSLYPVGQWKLFLCPFFETFAKKIKVSNLYIMWNDQFIT